jgi:hypothetical protein
MTLVSPFRSILPAAACALLIAGCSAFEPEYTACPPIKAVEGAERVSTIGATLGQPITMRINGVTARCVATSDGFDMDIELGLFARRDMSTSTNIEEIAIDATFAFLDSNDQVVERKVVSETAYFRNSQGTSRPKLDISIDVPSGTRVIMGLGKLADEQ